MKFARLLAVCFLAASAPVQAQSFSCPIGKQAACLDYGDKVCDSILGKCVPHDAQCFDSFTCNYAGFVCKSDMDDLARTAERMADSYDEFRACISRADDMEDVAQCVRLDIMRL